MNREHTFVTSFKLRLQRVKKKEDNLEEISRNEKLDALSWNVIVSSNFF